MNRPVKLDFEPLTLEQTAKSLGVPKARALKILAMAGLGPEALRASRRPKRKVHSNRNGVRRAKASSKS